MIIVRTKVAWDQRRSMVGNMYEPIDTYSDKYLLRGGWDLKKKWSRPATSNEIISYRAGIRNIRNIKTTIDNFSIV